jgi:hypothetical protein
MRQGVEIKKNVKGENNIMEVKEKENKGVILVGLLFVLIFVLVCEIGLWFLEAVVVRDLWNWFILPVTGFKFEYWQMFGALLIPSVLCLSSSINKSISNADNDTSDLLVNSIVSIVMRLMFLLIFWGIGAWIV